MRWLLLPLALVVATPGSARDPMPLSPYDWSGGIAPYRPAPIAENHPLFRKVAVEPVIGMPDRIGGTFILVTRPEEVNDALRATLDRSNMLAGDGTAPFAILSVKWIEFALPFKISTSSTAKVTLRYELRRADDGRVIFRRDVVTSSTASGGDGSTRARGTGRAAILGNVAGALWCLDKAAYGQAPANCAAEVRGEFRD